MLVLHVLLLLQGEGGPSSLFRTYKYKVSRDCTYVAHAAASRVCCDSMKGLRRGCDDCCHYGSSSHQQRHLAALTTSDACPCQQNHALM
jgi:hypothetical protein